jgi:5-methylcytosine-specific restriction protein A
MPMRAGRPCAWPGCAIVIRDGRFCDEHQRRKQKQQDAERGSAAARGYDARWRRLRARYLRRHPLCVECQRFEHTMLATDVDHIRPRSAGGSDEESNLQALCHPHHSAKTLREIVSRIGHR